jgi:RNA polymerase sigma factor FliA
MHSASAHVPLPRRRSAGADNSALWTEFVANRSPALREQLIKSYLDFARIMAAKMYAKRMFTEMEFADYLQFARVGLVESIDRFEPQRGFRFETFAASRINGAMLSGIERSTEIQEQIAARRRMLGQRLASLEQDAPADMGPEAAFARLAELAIGLAVGFVLEDSGMHREEDAEYADNSYHGIELKQLRERLAALLAALAPNQQQVIRSHYLQHMAFEEIATAMSLSRGRVSQIHKEALGNLRQRLRSWREVDLRC